MTNEKMTVPRLARAINLHIEVARCLFRKDRPEGEIGRKSKTHLSRQGKGTNLSREDVLRVLAAKSLHEVGLTWKQAGIMACVLDSSALEGPMISFNFKGVTVMTIDISKLKLMVGFT